MLASIAVGVALTIGTATPASAAASAPTTSSGPKVEGCKGIYGQPLLPYLCTKPYNYQPLPQGGNGTPWAALRACVTNYQEAAGALKALAAADPRGKAFLVLYTSSYCLYSLSSGG